MRDTAGRIGALALAATIALTGVAEAKTFKVTRTNDPKPGKCKASDCSLREAVLAANNKGGKDKVVLPKTKTYKLTRSGLPVSGRRRGENTDGDLDVSDDAVIMHKGGGKAKINAAKLDNRIFNVKPGASMTLSKLVLTRGAPLGDGGAIESGGDLTIKKSVLKKNVTGDDGGAIDMDGDLESPKLTLKSTKVLKNTADDEGGGIDADDANKVKIIKSTVSGNKSLGDNAGGIEAGGEGDVLISKSTIANNKAATEGGGLTHAITDGLLTISSSTFSGNKADGDGGGLAVEQANAEIVNSTFDGNSAGAEGGGIYLRSVDAELNATTITRNVAASTDPSVSPANSGGGIYAEDVEVNVRNSLLVKNVLGANGQADQDCEADSSFFGSSGGNVLSDAALNCDVFQEPGDIETSNAKIAALKKNGGPTMTVALKKGSPAIGNADGPSSPKKDQRGNKRDKNPDSGAFER